ncbi:MAG: DUF2336 domain-containing protein [Proteobacteria bacterium]|nr:DUF2336 domain-containing protein [Pseudomonadota bacterium]
MSSSIEPAALSYAEQKQLARDGDSAVRRELAERSDIRPEVLYFLAEDEAPEVRRAIAVNESTPRHADMLLVEDPDDEARCNLARKITRLAPQLSREQRSQVEKLTFEILDRMARDQLTQVRQIVAEEVKHLDTIPEELINRLARDAETAVCGPVLQYSPLLTDEDLLEIIESEPVRGALSAISKRDGVRAPVADAIVHTQDETAVATLLANSSAQIREETLDQIIEQAPQKPSWHSPLVDRPHLSQTAVQRITQFVTASLLTKLEARHKLDADTSRKVAKAVGERLGPQKKEKKEKKRKTGKSRKKKPRDENFDAAGIDDDRFLTALSGNDRDFMLRALVGKTHYSGDMVQRMMDSQNPRVVTALAWKAGFRMRTALQLQLRGARISHTRVLNPRDGVDYPFPEAELERQLEFFTDFYSKTR